MFKDYAFSKILPITPTEWLVGPEISESRILTRWRAANAHNVLFTGSAGHVGADEDDFHALQRRKDGVIRNQEREEKVTKVKSLHVRKKPKVVQF